MTDLKKIEYRATRDGYGEALKQLGRTNPAVVVLTADVAESTRVQEFAESFPKRFIETGVAEQNMMGIAAGLALSGKIPFVSSYAVFNPGRNWDQLRVAVCYAKANVKVVGAHAGISVGPDGATHQALEDIAITRVLPNLTVLVPADFEEAYQATLEATKIKGPVYIRLAREKTAIFTEKKQKFSIGKATVLHSGRDVAIIGAGPILFEALVAAKDLEKKGIGCEVINLRTIKPIDEAAIVRAARKCARVVTVEEHQVMGGVGSAVAEILGQYYPVPLEMIGMKNSFGESGTPELLAHKYGMDSEAILRAVLKSLKRK